MSERSYHGATSHSLKSYVTRPHTKSLHGLPEHLTVLFCIKPFEREKSRIFLKVTQKRMCRKEGNVLFNDALNTFYLRLYGVISHKKECVDLQNMPAPYGTVANGLVGTEFASRYQLQPRWDNTYNSPCFLFFFFCFCFFS